MLRKEKNVQNKASRYPIRSILKPHYFWEILMSVLLIYLIEFSTHLTQFFYAKWQLPYFHFIVLLMMFGYLLGVILNKNQTIPLFVSNSKKNR